MDAPRNQIERVRALTPELRADLADGGVGTLTGHFAVFNEETTIDSFWEGRFREIIAPGAFTRTMEQRTGSIRCIYEHGRDPMFGNKPLGSPTFGEDDRGATYDVELFDTQLNREHVVPAARSGQLGASFAFDVLGETWDDEPADGGLPVRTITEVRLYEFGPCPFPAYEGATAGVRTALANLDTLSADQLAALRSLTLPAATGDETTTTSADTGDVDDAAAAARAAWLRNRQLTKGRS